MLPRRETQEIDWSFSMLVDLLQGDEMMFLSTVDKILKECRSIDKDMKNLPDFRFAQLFSPPPT